MASTTSDQIATPAQVATSSEPTTNEEATTKLGSTSSTTTGLASPSVSAPQTLAPVNVDKSTKPSVNTAASSNGANLNKETAILGPPSYLAAASSTRPPAVGPSTGILPPNIPVYTTPAILALPPTAVLTKQEMDFRANLLNPNNDLFWTARGLIRPPLLNDALKQGHDILKYEGHLTQKQGGRRLSAQFGGSRGGGGGSCGPIALNPVTPTPSAVITGPQTSWRTPPVQPILAPNPAFITKQEMDFRANQLNPNNVCLTCFRSPVLQRVAGV